MPRIGASKVGFFEFQSAPGREAGRCISTTSVMVPMRWFQSAPGREAGRCLRPAFAIDQARKVSIRARP